MVKYSTLRVFSFVVLFSVMISLTSCIVVQPSTPENVPSVSTSENISSTTPETPEVNETGINVDGSVISWANMKVDNPDLQLTEEQLQVVKYFDNDYLRVTTYDNLQRYPKIYRNAQVSFWGIITKILQMDDETYECLFWLHGELDYDTWSLPEDRINKNELLVIRGKQPENSRVAVGDELCCYGRYIDLQSVTVDGVSAYYPVISINYTAPSGFDGQYPRFDLSTIKPIAQTIFGKDIKIKEPVCGEDYEYDELHSSLYYFYLVTPDNQSNSNFSQFEFSLLNGFIRDANSTVDVERLFNVAADFEHYIISVYDRNLHLMYLEYYDRDFKKIWSREFENVDTIPYDYTTKEIALVAGNDLYLIDTQTGEDVREPIFVGEKVSVNISEDGILMIGTGNKDNVMKVDRQGTLLWKTSVDLDVTGCEGLQIIDGTVIACLVHEELAPSEYYFGDMTTAYRADMVAIDSSGAIISQFTDYEYDYGW